MLELSITPMDILVELLSDQNGVEYEYISIDLDSKTEEKQSETAE